MDQTTISPEQPDLLHGPTEATLITGDCLEAMREMPDNSVDSIVTDPPYGLKFMGKKWDCEVPGVEVWREALRVLKPGGHLLAFAGTRTQHRMCVNIEDAGFKIRDMLAWVYGSGFPKSLDIGKALDKAAGAEREIIGKIAKPTGSSGPVMKTGMCGGDGNLTAPATPEAKQWDGWGTALKPALEPITLARKPLSESTIAGNVLEHGTGGVNVGACRVGDEDVQTIGTSSTTPIYGKFNGAANSVPHSGRFPANLLHDGSPEVTALFPGEGEESASRFFYCGKASKADRDEGLEGLEGLARQTMGSGIGGQPDQNRANNKNTHATVKPTDLMRYLCRLITPPGGTVLDPFMGSGSTGKAAMKEGFNFIGCELNPEYVEIAKRRIRRS